MIGYLNNPNTCENAIVNGWLETGDIGYQIGGWWYIVDRAKVDDLTSSAVWISLLTLFGRR